ncbi:MAG TPA: T9SS type A sorting domain-containing protein, partial [Paludibacteraceae bacterium]|nr:T9SS type A sorting domain-containing protein [Paludibacteraceae bacterium]
KGAGDSIMNGSTMLKGKYLRNTGSYGKDTWVLEETDKVYITVPDAVADGGYLQKRVSLTQLDPFISFFVQADRTGSLNFATSSREQVAKVMRAPVVDYNEVVLNFDVAGKSDNTTIILDKARNTSYEIGQDLLKWKGKWGKTPYLYTFDNTNNPLAFNAINYDEAKVSVPVAFYMPTSYARYTFSIDRNASLLQGIEHVYLLRNGSVIADLLVSDYTNTNIKRMAENKDFAITIQRAGNISTPIIETPTEGLVPYAWTSGHDLKLAQLPAEGNVIVRDAVGRIIASAVLTGDDTQMFTLPCDGVYIVSVINKQNNYTIKVVMQ